MKIDKFVMHLFQLKSVEEPLSYLKIINPQGPMDSLLNSINSSGTRLIFFLLKALCGPIKTINCPLTKQRGVITLVPKKGKYLCSLKNWWPISLFNIDYKILTKVLAQRLQIVLKQIINPDHVGYMTN